MRFRFSPLLAAFCLWSASDTLAALRWQTMLHEEKISPSAAAVVASFPFTNTGDTPVTIRSVKSGCDCTVIELAQMTYAPGERGELKAVFDAKGRSGVQDKVIQVFTDDSPQPALLNLRVKITELVTVTPRLLWWKTGAPSEPKEVMVTLHPGERPPVLTVISEHPGIKAELHAKDAGGQRLVVYPLTTASALKATIHLTASVGADHPPRVYAIYAQVR